LQLLAAAYNLAYSRVNCIEITTGKLTQHVYEIFLAQNLDF